ncbi:hypothetical protein DL93DRAFT_2098322 [Clavulina sp. PMI_390]|nr:hypothetical protein DL93DRAFT_2098322 [Clavulina sp. PMI_390]
MQEIGHEREVDQRKISVIARDGIALQYSYFVIVREFFVETPMLSSGRYNSRACTHGLKNTQLGISIEKGNCYLCDGEEVLADGAQWAFWVIDRGSRRFLARNSLNSDGDGGIVIWKRPGGSVWARGCEWSVQCTVPIVRLAVEVHWIKVRGFIIRIRKNSALSLGNIT